jgi:hypothetical protein
MRVSVSIPRDDHAAAPTQGVHYRRWVPVALAIAYLAAHLPWLAPSLEDIDSINFALGLRDFNPAAHQPHPPGYPVYIALGRISLAVIERFGPAMSQPAASALALSFWSALAGALALVCASKVFVRLVPSTVAWADALVAANALFWMCGVRPMSDMPGLAAALASQALLLRAAEGRTDQRALLAGAFLAAFALGIRAQTLWLTVPLVGYAIICCRDLGLSRTTGRVLLFYAAGVLAWAAPLVIAAGGVRAYLAALSTQAGEDFAFVDMLWANPTPRRLAFGLYQTFTLPWASTPIAVAVLAASAAGMVVMLTKERKALVALAVAFGPYSLFHLVFQETLTVRYALPVVVPVALLAMRAVAAAGRAAPFIGVPLAAASLFAALPGVVAYGRESHPAFRAAEDIARRAEVSPPAMLVSHFGLRRAIRASGLTGLPVVDAPNQYEWMELVKYWAGDGRRPVWFLADPRRTDLALIDPVSRVDVVRYRWDVENRPELSGVRPIGADWYRLLPPGWFLAEGWSLTPEAGGLSRARGRGPDHAPIVGYVKRSDRPAHLMIGGRHLGEAGDPAADFELALDGVVIDRWTLTFDHRNFLRFLDLPRGVPAGDGHYARLTVSAAPPAGETRRAPVAIRQFDLQPSNEIVYGFGPGWHEDEYVTETGARWRWTSDRSVLQVRGPVQAIRVRLYGESPLRYFSAAPAIKVTAAGRVIAELHPTSDFRWDLVVPADAVAASGGDIAIETDRVFVPADAGRSVDTRRLGLRIWACHVQAIV